MNRAEILVGDFKAVGINQVDVDTLRRKWNHLWFIAQWDTRDYSKAGNGEITSTQYRLIKMRRKDSPEKEFQTVISEEQAKELIEVVGLTGVNGGFRSATTWKKID